MLPPSQVLSLSLSSKAKAVPSWLLPPKPWTNIEHVSARCVQETQKTHMTDFIHFSWARGKDETTTYFRKSIKEGTQDGGGGVVGNDELKKPFKCAHRKSLQLPLNPLLQVTLSASCIDYFYVIYLLKFLLMDTLESSSAFNVPTTHWSGHWLIGYLLCCQAILWLLFSLHIFILGAVSIVSHYTNGNYWYGNY